MGLHLCAQSVNQHILSLADLFEHKRTSQHIGMSVRVKLTHGTNGTRIQLCSTCLLLGWWVSCCLHVVPHGVIGLLRTIRLPAHFPIMWIVLSAGQRVGMSVRIELASGANGIVFSALCSTDLALDYPLQFVSFGELSVAVQAYLDSMRRLRVRMLKVISVTCYFPVRHAS